MKTRGYLSKALLISTFLLAGCSSDEILVPQKDEKNHFFAEYEFSFDYSNIEKLKEGDSIKVEMKPQYIKGSISEAEANSIINNKTKATEGIPTIGVIKDLGNIKVNFKANSGENLVPAFFAGPRKLTICRVWEVSLKIDLTGQDVAVKGSIGEQTGWKRQYSGNPQTRDQAFNGSGEITTYSTYIYKLISDVNGVNPGRDLYLPLKPEDARIYVRYVYY